MRTFVTIVLVLVLIPVSFLLMGIVFGVIHGNASDGLGASGAVLAVILWIAASIALVKRRHR